LTETNPPPEKIEKTPEKGLTFHRVIEELKKKVSVTDLVSLKGDRAECPVYGNTETSSFQYFPISETWHCYKCRDTGDVIKLFGKINNLSYKDAVLELCKIHKVPLQSYSKEDLEKYSEIQAILEEFMELCHENLKNSKFYEWEKKKRGFTDDTMEQFKVGLVEKKVMQYMDNKYEKPELYEAGFLNERYNWVFGKRIVYPYFSANKKPIYFIYRLIDIEKDFHPAKYVKQMTKIDLKKAKANAKFEIPPYIKELLKEKKIEEIKETLYRKYIKNELFGLDSLSQFRDKSLIITEGITDAMSVIQANYPCLSPVTVRFKEQDYDRAIHFCKRFDKVIVINDSELNDSGLKGALDSLKYLFKQGINVYLGEIPLPTGIDKIDLDEYLKQDNTIKGQELLLKKLIVTSSPAIDYFLEKIIVDYVAIKSVQEKSFFINRELAELFELISLENIHLNLFELIKEILSTDNRIMVSKTTINRIHTEVIRKLNEQMAQQESNDDLEDLRARFPNNLYLEYDDDIIELSNLGIQLIHSVYDIEARSFDAETISNWYYKFLFKTKDIYSDNQLLYSIKLVMHDPDNLNINGENSFYLLNKSYNDLIRKTNPFLKKTSTGKDVFTTILDYFVNKLQYKEPKYIIGWDNGWILPIKEEDDKYGIITFTDIQKLAYNRMKGFIKDYNIKEKEKIRNDLKEFILITQMDVVKLCMIISWSIAVAFKTYLIRKYQFFAIHFYRVHDGCKAGDTLSTKPKLEDYLASGTFPIMGDEYENPHPSIVPVLKETATAITNWEKKKDYSEVVSKPKVASFLMTGNKVPSVFIEQANNTKLILLQFSNEEVVVDDERWMELWGKLKEHNLFSFMYDYTKEWTNMDLDSFVIPINTEAWDSELDKKYPRLKKSYRIMKFGLKMFKEAFDIDLETIAIQKLLIEHNEKNNIKLAELPKGKTFRDQILGLLIRSRRILGSAVYDDFISFCIEALNYSPEAKSKNWLSKGMGSLSITKGKHVGEYYTFDSINLRDFKQFTGEKRNMSELGNILEQTIEDNEIFCHNARIENDGAYRRKRVILIRKRFLEIYDKGDLTHDPEDKTEFRDFKESSKPKEHQIFEKISVELHGHIKNGWDNPAIDTKQTYGAYKFEDAGVSYEYFMKTINECVDAGLLKLKKETMKTGEEFTLIMLPENSDIPEEEISQDFKELEVILDTVEEKSKDEKPDFNKTFSEFPVEEKEFLLRVYDRVREVFSANKYKPLELTNVKQGIALDFSKDWKIVYEKVEILITYGVLEKVDDTHIIFSENWK
jgi:CHC2-type zinc finger protein